MDVIKVSVLIGFTTAPTNLNKARPHSGSFSEQIWTTGDPITLADATLLATARARLLPAGATVIGVKQQSYEITGDKLAPGGASTIPLNIPGRQGTLDVPQACLHLRMTSFGNANVGKYDLRCMPDEQVLFGEYQPTTAFTLALNLYMNTLIQGSYGFVGRNLGAATTRCLGGLNDIMAVQNSNGFALGDRVRFVRVKSLTGVPVEGVFTLKASVAVNTLQFVEPVPSSFAIGGLVRKNEMIFCQYSAGSIGRIGVKKVGRPSDGYRGRRSKRRVMA